MTLKFAVCVLYSVCMYSMYSHRWESEARGQEQCLLQLLFTFLFLFFFFRIKINKQNTLKLDVVTHAVNPTTRETKAGGSLISRPA